MVDGDVSKPKMESARKERAEYLKRCNQMVQDNNDITEIVEDQRKRLQQMKVDGLIKLKCVTCRSKQHCLVNSDERCRQVVEQFEIARREMLKN